MDKTTPIQRWTFSQCQKRWKIVQWPSWVIEQMHRLVMRIKIEQTPTTQGMIQGRILTNKFTSSLMSVHLAQEEMHMEQLPTRQEVVGTLIPSKGPILTAGMTIKTARQV